jgi:phenylpropionate dioxygenase-like ring-hydroxylating dioxygenase large terminal subunit
LSPICFWSARTIPACWYRDAELAAWERRAIFGATWQFAGLAALVAEPGCFFITEIAGESILIVRDGEGGLRAFYSENRVGHS